ncbi:hypothetical protein EXN66_Car019893 [Channa argus]|uniref:Uncharacterized protein n=1 Tax=Channa argus TaxID=215402 RepID=A0A6G1QNZ8_CHAAH|nr:hypothetical protein EXN66_Car019893 [Channa argus]
MVQLSLDTTSWCVLQLAPETNDSNHHHLCLHCALKVKEEVSRWFSTCQGDFNDCRCCPDAGQRWGAGRFPSDLQHAVKRLYGTKGDGKL